MGFTGAGSEVVAWVVTSVSEGVMKTYTKRGFRGGYENLERNQVELAAPYGYAEALLK